MLIAGTSRARGDRFALCRNGALVAVGDARTIEAVGAPDIVVECRDAVRAQAAAAAACASDHSVVVVADDRHAALEVFERHGPSLVHVGSQPAWEGVLRAREALGRVLGILTVDSTEDVLARGASVAALARSMETAWCSRGPGRVLGAEVDAALTSAAEACPVPLDSAASPHRQAQRLRGALAASWFDLAAAVLNDTTERWRARQGVADVIVGGRALRWDALRDRVWPKVPIAPLPDADGEVVGTAFEACFAAGLSPVRPSTLQLGALHTDEEIKGVLENCRLDYVYEPSVPRLMTRVSALLERGLVVAWHQGRAEAGSKALGGRGLLADPSLKFTRENINQYALGVRVDSPLPVSMLATALPHLLPEAPLSPFGMGRWRLDAHAPWCVGAVEPGGWIGYHSVSETNSPMLHELLRVHAEKTGRAALAHVPCGPIAHGTSPRDAVAMTFSHAIDALVIGRFVVMKDVWLLRTLPRP